MILAIWKYKNCIRNCETTTLKYTPVIFYLDEVISLLFRREIYSKATRFVEGLLSATNLKYLIVERVTKNRFDEAWLLRKRFQDKPLISFTDLTSMVIMKELGIFHILSGDEHFISVGMGFVNVP